MIGQADLEAALRRVQVRCGAQRIGEKAGKPCGALVGELIEVGGCLYLLQGRDEVEEPHGYHPNGSTQRERGIVWETRTVGHLVEWTPLAKYSPDPYRWTADAMSNEAVVLLHFCCGRVTLINPFGVRDAWVGVASQRVSTTQIEHTDGAAIIITDNNRWQWAKPETREL